MDKRSFNFLCVLVAVSMVALGTYKVAKKKNNAAAAPAQFISKTIK